MVISTLSVHSALLLAGSGARENTQTEIWNAMKLTDSWVTKYLEMYKIYIDQLNVSYQLKKPFFSCIALLSSLLPFFFLHYLSGFLNDDLIPEYRTHDNKTFAQAIYW